MTIDADELARMRVRIGELDQLVASMDEAEDQLISERDKLTADLDAARALLKKARRYVEHNGGKLASNLLVEIDALGKTHEPR